MVGLDKRSMERFNLDVPALVGLKNDTSTDSKTTVELRTRNICAGGAFLMIDSPFQTGTKVEIDVRLSLFDNSVEKVQKSGIHLSGSVIRTDADGMAVKFDKKFQIFPVE